MVRDGYRFGYVIARVEELEGEKTLSFPTNPAVYFHSHEIEIKDFEIVICGVGIFEEETSTWLEAHKNKEIIYLGDTWQEAKEKLRSIWATVRNKLHIKEDGIGFRRFGGVLGIDI